MAAIGEYSKTGRSLDVCDGFSLCCGAIPLDLTKRQALLLFYKPKAEYFFPKGHKDAGESMEEAALRECMEETGYRCKLLAHKSPTNATKAASSGHTEPIAVQQRFRGEVRKIIFWYLAAGDASKPAEGQSLEEGEDFEARWVPVEKLELTLTFEDDKQIGQRALEAAGLS